MYFDNQYHSAVCIKSDITEEIEVYNGIFLRSAQKEDYEYLNNIVAKKDLLHVYKREIENCHHKIVFKTSNPQQADKFLESITIALRLITYSGSGILFTIYFENDMTSTLMQNELFSRYHYGFPYSEINDFNISEFKKILKFFIENDSEKINLISKLYKYISSGIPSPEENKFLNLMTILEMLYCGKNEDQAIKQLISNRVAILFQKNDGRYINSNYYTDSKDEIIAGTRLLYKIRSEIVHNGKSKMLTPQLHVILTQLTRLSILEYLFNPHVFTSENLKLLYDSPVRINLKCKNAINCSNRTL